jgi:hypothetical protein
MADTLEDIIQRDMLKFLGRAVAALDEADRLIDCPYRGTERWVNEVDAWRRTKALLLDCNADVGSADRPLPTDS